MGFDATGAQEIGGALGLFLLSLQAAKIATWTVGLLGAVAGVVLLVAPRGVLQPGGTVRQILFDADLARLFDRRYVIERRVYRWHRAVGFLVFVGSVASLALLILLVMDSRSEWMRLALGKLGFRVVVATLAIIGLALVAIAVTLMVRPSLLKGIEAAANRWIAPRASRRFDTALLVLRAPRLAGAALFAAGLFCLWPS